MSNGKILVTPIKIEFKLTPLWRQKYPDSYHRNNYRFELFVSDDNMYYIHCGELYGKYQKYRVKYDSTLPKFTKNRCTLHPISDNVILGRGICYKFTDYLHDTGWVT